MNPSNSNETVPEYSQDYLRQRENLQLAKQEQDARAAAFVLARTLVQSPGFRNLVQRKLEYMQQKGQNSVLVRYQQDLIKFCVERQRNSVLPDPQLRDLLLNPAQEVFRVKYLANALSREATRQIQSAMEDVTEGTVYYFRYSTHCIYQLDRRLSRQEWQEMPMEDRYLRGLILIRARQQDEEAEAAAASESPAQETDDVEAEPETPVTTPEADTQPSQPSYASAAAAAETPAPEGEATTVADDGTDSSTSNE